MLLINLLNNAKEEMSMIGILLIGYSELEIGLMHIVMVSRDEFDAPLKAMYRIRGEDQRIKIADGLARHALYDMDENLGNQFAIGIGAMHHCRQIRNQYAHCQWWDAENKLVRFVALEEASKENKKYRNFDDLHIRSINLELLQLQKEYFEYVQELFEWITHEGRVIRGFQQKNPFTCPKPRERPSIYIP